MGEKCVYLLGDEGGKEQRVIKWKYNFLIGKLINNAQSQNVAT